MPSIRWIRNILVDGVPSTIEIMIGAEHISDKCYVRIDNNAEVYFTPVDDTREGVVYSGIQLLKQAFHNRNLSLPSGMPFTWE